MDMAVPDQNLSCHRNIDGRGARLLDGTLAVGILLSVSSQLRIKGLPLGPGELCLSVWIAAASWQLVRRGSLRLRPALSSLLAFWAMFAIAQSLGVISAYMIGDRHDPDAFLHDLMAFPIMAALSCLSAAGPDADHRLRRVAWYLAGLACASIALQIAEAFDLLPFLDLQPWYWNRFRGWSENPNQLSLFCSLLVPICLVLAESAVRGRARLLALLYAGTAVTGGMLTLSNTFRLAMVLSVGVFLAVKLRLWTQVETGMRSLKFVVASFAAVTIVLVPISALPLVFKTTLDASTALKEMSRDNDQTEDEAALRVYLWGQAIDRSLESHLIGLGPGPHIPIPPQTAAFLKSVPEGDENRTGKPVVGANPNFESHNANLELLQQGGLPLVCAYVWLLIVAGLTAYRTGLGMLTAIVPVLIVAGMFHVITRTPLVWFALSLCMAWDGTVRRTPSHFNVGRRAHRCASRP